MFDRQHDPPPPPDSSLAEARAMPWIVVYALLLAILFFLAT